MFPNAMARRLPESVHASDAIHVKSIRWRSVTGGITAVVTLVVIIVLVLVYAKSGALHGSRFRLFVAAPDADNLRPGSAVWLNGQRVGVVRAIQFNQPTVPVALRVVIELEVLSAVERRIRIDSRASLQSGGTLIGEPVVYIQAGSQGARRVEPGDTLHATGNPDLEVASAKAASSLEQLPVLLANGRDIVANGKMAANRLSALRDGSNGAMMWQRTKMLMARASGGHGSAKMVGDTMLQASMGRSLAALDSLHMLLATGVDQVGRFRRDSSLARSVGALRIDVARLRTLTASTDGTLGRLSADSAVQRGLDSAFAELTALVADIKKHPLRYAHVF